MTTLSKDVKEKSGRPGAAARAPSLAAAHARHDGIAPPTTSGESTITSKGQTTVPAEVREALNAKPGTKMLWHVMPNGRVIVRVKSRSLLDLEGSLKADKHVTIDEMNPFGDSR